MTFDTVTQQSHIDAVSDYGFSPQYEGDYNVNLGLTFEPDGDGDEWTVAVFDNGVQMGDGFTFKTKDIGSDLIVYASFGGHMHPGDIIDARLWPSKNGKSGTVKAYSYDMDGRGIVQNTSIPGVG